MAQGTWMKPRGSPEGRMALGTVPLASGHPRSHAAHRPWRVWLPLAEQPISSFPGWPGFLSAGDPF